MRTAQRDRAISSFLRGLPLEAKLVTSLSVITQEPSFVRSIACFHAQANISSVQLKTRSGSGDTVSRVVRFGIGNAQLVFKNWLYMPNGFALSLAGAVGTAGNYGAMAIYIRLANIPWLRDLDQPDIEEIYARAATLSEVARGQDAA